MPLLGLPSRFRPLPRNGRSSTVAGFIMVLLCGQTARQGQLPRAPLKQVYRPKKKEEVQSMDVDSERTTEFDIIQVGTMEVPIEKSLAMEPTSSEKVVEDQGSSATKTQQRFLPKWCPDGLTRTQKRKLQRLCFWEKQEQELEKQRDEFFNQVKPMIPQKEWKAKEDQQATTCHSETVAQAVRPGDAEAPGVSSSSSSARDGKSTSVPTAEDDEQLVDYSSSPERMNLDVNVLHMSMNGDMLSEEEAAHLDFAGLDRLYKRLDRLGPNNPRFAASDGVPPEVVIVGFRGASVTGGLTGPYRRSDRLLSGVPARRILTTARSSAFPPSALAPQPAPPPVSAAVPVPLPSLPAIFVFGDGVLLMSATTTTYLKVKRWGMLPELTTLTAA
ncbi:hypothetical protein HU200_022838 [Digitaria exilis]|uniref:Uncharacterized protein n=1 Tax=Digitaria exilis TaxID=1010633 RepID=A0A835CCE6_9POAL|nr:hypothetical protein HU200_022838 [Digitaria exilis]